MQHAIKLARTTGESKNLIERQGNFLPLRSRAEPSLQFVGFKGPLENTRAAAPGLSQPNRSTTKLARRVSPQASPPTLLSANQGRRDRPVRRHRPNVFAQERGSRDAYAHNLQQAVMSPRPPPTIGASSNPPPLGDAHGGDQCKGSKVMSKFSTRELKRRLSGRFCGGAMSAIAATTPLFAFQDLGAATLGDAARRPPSRSAQASQAEPQSARPEATPPPQPPPTPSANAPATAAVSPTNEKNNEIMSTPATVVDGQQLESILGKTVLSPTGEDMGRIVDVMVDRAGQMRAAIIDFGGFLGSAPARSPWTGA